ncbi:MAG: hypothetical protein ABII23_01640 [bacterium]
MKQIIRTRWFQITAAVVCTIGIVYGLVYVDVVSRAREAYIEGEKYWAWHYNPNDKKLYLEEKLKDELAEIEQKFSKKKIDKNQYEQEVQIAQFNFQESLKESSIKYAYVWYQTAVELFTPPESKWVKLCREKMPVAKEMWKAELRAKNIPFEDYMLE